MGIIRLNICNLIATAEIPNESRLAKTIRERYSNFHLTCATTRADIVISCLVKSSGNSYRPAILPSGTGWDIRGPGISCQMSRANGRFYVKGEVRGNIYSFDTLLRLALLQVLNLKNGFLIHALGLGIGNNGYLLPGESGRGKTTLAKKSPQSVVLSDELVCMRIMNGKPIILSTPFWGEFRAPGEPFGKPLKGIYFLHKSNIIKVEKLPKGDAVKEMLKLVLFFSRDKLSTERLLKTVRQCIMETPCYNIWLAKKSSYESIKRVISGK
ncbi:MAG: hypothetical protein HY811_08080 [Planctomycetes bacterium]|nr:hypothetical protein [Planctomycetota bacterium]